MKSAERLAITGARREGSAVLHFSIVQFRGGTIRLPLSDHAGEVVQRIVRGIKGQRERDEVRGRGQITLLVGVHNAVHALRRSAHQHRKTKLLQGELLCQGLWIG